jgi:hypothetical protein
MLLVLGDFNATLDSGFVSSEHMNSNHELISDMLDECQLEAINTRFEKPLLKLVTFNGPNDRNVGIDHILVRKKWANSFKDCEALCPGEVVSDHKLLFCKLRWRMKTRKNELSSQKKDYSCLSDPHWSEKYSANLEKNLPNLSQDWDYNDLASSILKSTEDFPIKAPPLHVKGKSGSKSGKHDDKAAYRALRKKETRAFSVQRIEEIAAEINSMHVSKQATAAWKNMTVLTGKESKPSGLLEKDSKKAAKKWMDYNACLYAKKQNVPEDNSEFELTEKYVLIMPESVVISDDVFSLPEIEAAIFDLNLNKALDPENLCAEMLRDPKLAPYLLKSINLAYSTGKPPEQWLNMDMMMVYKKGDRDVCSNYRGISIMSITSKLYFRLMANRIIPIIDPLLRVNQNGFRKLRSANQHILLLRRLIEETRNSKDDKLVLIFIDFMKAFDTIIWTELWAILAAYRIPGKMIIAIKSLYEGSGASVKVGSAKSGMFNFNSGVKQGCVLAPFLFIVCIDFIMRKAVPNPKLGIKLFTASKIVAKGEKDIFVTDVAFADDITLVSPSIEHGQRLLCSVEEEARKIGLQFNHSKCEALLIGCSGDIEIQAGILQQCDDFKYLGSWIFDSDKDFKVRKALAWSACTSLKNLWNSSLSKVLKTNCFKALVQSILLYGAETWTMTSQMIDRLDGCYTRLLSYIFQLDCKKDHPTRKMIYGDLPDISSVLRSRRLEFFGHNHRCDGLIKHALFYETPGKNKIGGQFMTYLDTIKKDFDGHIGVPQLKRVAGVRESWKAFIK